MQEITKKPRQLSRRLQKGAPGHYNDAVDAGGPRTCKYGRDISSVALLAVVDALEHAIFTAQQ
jgi:hypothetical protein